MAKRAKTFLILCFLGAMFLLSACQALGSSGLKVDNEWSDPDALVIHNGTLITAVDGEPIPQGAVLIQNGLITAVGPENGITIPFDAVMIDVEGSTIMPGIVEGRASELLNRLELKDGQISDSGLKGYLEPALNAGVTSLRAVSWDWEKQQGIAEFRAALEKQGSSIPTFVISGTPLTHKNGAAIKVYYSNSMVGVESLEDTIQTTEQMVELGVDQISLVMTLTKDGSVTSPDPMDPALSLDQLEDIVEVAHSHDKRVLAQTIFEEDLALVLEAGVDEIISWPVQARSISDEMITTLAENSVPLLTGFSVGQANPQPGDVRRFLDAGGTLVYGTFGPNAQAIDSVYLEFKRMSTHGMTPLEIVQAATINAAEAVGLGETTGSLEPGKEADILVINGDLFENIMAVKNVAYVINNGELIVQPEGAS